MAVDRWFVRGLIVLQCMTKDMCAGMAVKGGAQQQHPAISPGLQSDAPHAAAALTASADCLGQRVGCHRLAVCTVAALPQTFVLAHCVALLYQPPAQ